MSQTEDRIETDGGQNGPRLRTKLIHTEGGIEPDFEQNYAGP